MSLRRPAAGGWSTSAGPAASIPVPAHELLAHVWRDGMVESTHSGSVAILDPGGNVELAIGDIEAVCYPRSALKPVQAAAMVRSGLVLPAELLAVAAASHSGERAHREAVERILSTHDMGACVLGNNAGFPLDPEVRDEWICAGHEAGSLVQNCSGKHAAMVATAQTNGWSTMDYLDPGHPVQESVARTVEEFAGESAAHIGVDGCGAPLFALSLRGLTRSLGRIASRHVDTSGGAVADAMRSHPEMVGGRSRPVTQVMRSVPGLIAKDGAEGVQVAAFPDGTAIGVKIADGSQRARMPVTAAALAYCGVNAGELEPVDEATPRTAPGIEVVGRLALAWAALRGDTPSG